MTSMYSERNGFLLPKMSQVSLDCFPNSHYCDFTCVPWRLDSPATRLIIQLFVNKKKTSTLTIKKACTIDSAYKGRVAFIEYVDDVCTASVLSVTRNTTKIAQLLC